MNVKPAALAVLALLLAALALGLLVATPAAEAPVHDGETLTCREGDLVGFDQMGGPYRVVRENDALCADRETP